jgi:hypothetical protein
VVLACSSSSAFNVAHGRRLVCSSSSVFGAVHSFVVVFIGMWDCRRHCCSSSRGRIVGRLAVGWDGGNVAVAAVHITALRLGDAVVVVTTVRVYCMVGVSITVKSRVSNRL